MSSTTTFDTTQLEALASDVSGSVLLPGDDGYDEARRVHNGMIDRRPGADRPLPHRRRRRAAIALRARGGRSRSRCAAAGTTSPGAPSPTAA